MKQYSLSRLSDYSRYLPYKQTLTRRIHQSQNNIGPIRSYVVWPVIPDIDCAVMSTSGATPIQPDGYRAREVIFGWGWFSKAEIWNFGHLEAAVLHIIVRS